MSQPLPADLRVGLASIHADCYGWALACCDRDRGAAEDVLQNAYLRILEGRARFHEHSSFRTFVFGVIRVVAHEERRRMRVLRNPAPNAAEAIDTAPWPDAEAASAERRERLLGALAHLSPRQREVVELVFYHGMTIEEAAVVMRVRLGSARTHYERGKTHLRALLPREEYGNV